MSLTIGQVADPPLQNIEALFSISILASQRTYYVKTILNYEGPKWILNFEDKAEDAISLYEVS